MVCFFSFGPHSFKSFMLLAAFLLQKNKLLRLTQAVSQMSPKAKPHGRAPPPLDVCLAPSPMQQMQETFHIWFYHYGPPPLLEAALPQCHHLGSSRKPEKVYCMQLLNILFIDTEIGDKIQKWGGLAATLAHSSAGPLPSRLPK
jgi:hypothetical protein